jgi:hypothetical protein
MYDYFIKLNQTNLKDFKFEMDLSEKPSVICRKIYNDFDEKQNLKNIQ